MGRVNSREPSRPCSWLIGRSPPVRCRRQQLPGRSPDCPPRHSVCTFTREKRENAPRSGGYRKLHGRCIMPEKKTIERARKAKREGKAPTTQAGEFVREEMEHIREGKHGARSTKQAIAIGLSKARRAGVKLPPPRRGRTSASARSKVESDLERGRSPGRRPRPRRGASPANPEAC